MQASLLDELFSQSSRNNCRIDYFLFSDLVFELDVIKIMRLNARPQFGEAVIVFLSPVSR